MFGIKTTKFDAFIFKVEEQTAYIEVVDKDNEKSYMEIPTEDLEDNNIECKTGVVFHITVKKFRKWEKMEMSPCQRVVPAKREVDEMIEGYREKYKDV